MSRRRLTSVIVAAPGIKGWTGRMDLTGLDVYAGPNGSGKTTRLLAILAGLRGIAETPGSPVGEYVGPDRPSCTVTLGWDDGSTLVRDLGAVRGKRRVTADAQADSLAGRHLVRWDLSDFATATDAARALLLRGLVSSAHAWDAARVRSRVSALLAEAKVDAAIVADLWAAPAVTANSPAVNAYLDAALAWARDAYTEANATKATSGRAVEELQAQAAARTDAATPGRLADVRRRQEEVDREIAAISATMTGAEETGKAALRHQAEGDRMAATVGTYQAERDTAERALREAEGAVRPESAADTLRPQEDALAAASEVLRMASADLDAADLAHRQSLESIAGLRGQAGALERLRAEASGACRHCGGADPLDLSGRHTAAVEALAAAEADLPLAVLDRRTATAAKADAEAAVGRARDALASARAARDRQAVERRAALGRVDDARARLSRAEAAVARAEADLAAWRERPAPSVVAVETETMESQRKALEDERQALRRQADDLARAEGGEAAMQQAIARREAADVRLAAVKALGGALRSVQAEAAAEAYGPILEAARRLLDDAGVPLIPYMTSEAEWGADVGGHRVHFSALSDGERALVGAAFAYAFTTCSGAPWRCLVLDRLEAIDPVRAGRFIAAVRRACDRGDLDNFVGAIRSDEPLDAPAFHWIGPAATAPRPTAPAADPMTLF